MLGKIAYDLRTSTLCPTEFANSLVRTSIAVVKLVCRTDLINLLKRKFFSMDFLHSVHLGLKRHPLQFIAATFLAYSALWTIVESTTYFFTDLNLKGFAYYCVLVGLSLVIAFWRVKQKHAIKIRLAHSNTIINVYFGNIFEQKGYIAIPVNECFDSELGVPVSPKSLHGIVIASYFGGHTASFDQMLEGDLKGAQAVDVIRTQGKKRKFEVGTTVPIKIPTHQFLLFAFCLTDPETSKASASLTELVKALGGLCSKARSVLGGEKLVLPLVGSGLSGIGLPASNLLELILLVLVDESKRREVASTIDLVIHPSRFEEIDLKHVEKSWKQDDL